MNLFSVEYQRDPFPLYDQIRRTSPLFRDPQSSLWMLFDYDGVKRALQDHDAFSSRLGPADWIIFMDPPRHSKLRGLISQAFTPRSVANLEPRIRKLSRDLLNKVIEKGEMDLAEDFTIQLPMTVIAEMLGIPVADRKQFKRWIDVILNMSYTVPGGERAPAAAAEFKTITVEMNDYLTTILAERRSNPTDDLLTRLLQAELDGERLTQTDILGFFQLLLLAGSETTTNLINNAILCFIENPDQLARLKSTPGLLSSAIEEVLRYRSPLQWMFRVPTRDIEIHGQVLSAGSVVLAMIGSANCDPAHFPEVHRFDIARNPNPHLAFGHGLHFCLGAALARLEAKVALPYLLDRLKGFSLATDGPWEPRQGLQVHGPTRLPIRFKPAKPDVS